MYSASVESDSHRICRRTLCPPLSLSPLEPPLSKSCSRLVYACTCSIKGCASQHCVAPSTRTRIALSKSSNASACTPRIMVSAAAQYMVSTSARQAAIHVVVEECSAHFLTSEQGLRRAFEQQQIPEAVECRWWKALCTQRQQPSCSDQCCWHTCSNKSSEIE